MSQEKRWWLASSSRTPSLRYSTVQYSTVQYSTVQYSTVSRSRCPRRRGGAWPASPAPPASGSPCPRPARPAPPSLPTGGTRTGRGSWPMGAGYPGHVTRCPPITAHLSSHLTSTQPGEETRAWLGPRYHVSRAARAEQRHSHLHTCLNIYISIITRYIYSYR